MDYFDYINIMYGVLIVAVLVVAFVGLRREKKKAVKQRRNRLVNKSAEEKVLACFTATEKMVYREASSIAKQCSFSMAHTYRTLALLKDKGHLVTKNEGKKVLYAKVLFKVEQPVLATQESHA